MDNVLFFNEGFGEGMGFINKLVDKGTMDSCVVVLYQNRAQEMIENDKVIVIDRLYRDLNYERVMDIQALPPIGKKLMEDMLPYESMAIKLNIRVTDYPINLYEREKRNYYIKLRYWNYIFDKYSITHFFSENVPHGQDWWVAYGIARCRNISTLMMTGTTLSCVRLYGSKPATIGNHIAKEFDKCDELIESDYTYKHDGVGKRLEAIKLNVKNCNKYFNREEKRARKKLIKRVKKTFWHEANYDNLLLVNSRIFIAAILKYKNMEASSVCVRNI